MSAQKIEINRAPVLTLWAAVVAERLGYERDAALTLGRAVAGLNAQSKGRRLGIYDAPAEGESKGRGEREEGAEDKGGETARPETVALLGRQVPVVDTPAGVRAAKEGKPENADSVRRYLHVKFGEELEAAREAMEALAGSMPPETLATRAYDLYEAFRPEVPRGKRGWGAAGELDLDKVRELAKE